MESNKFFQMLSTRSSLGDNFFHEACKAFSIALLRRAEEMIDEPIPTILTTRNYNGEQCTHLIVNIKEIYAQDMMEIVLDLGADVNGQEACGGFTPLHLCVLKKNYGLAEWLCKVPGINLEAVNYANQTVYQLALECDERQIMEIVKKAGAKCEPQKVKKSNEL
uniref:Viral ankyrin n=1 Tax=Glyptapanteles indiensis TaxID=92994 RepID=B7S8V0_GLYIN|nr:viral ankyrin [Glyptapanteles indiensis]